MRPTKYLYRYREGFNVKNRFQFVEKCSNENRHTSQNASRGGGCLMLEQFPQEGHHLETARSRVLHRSRELTVGKVLSEILKKQKDHLLIYIYITALTCR